MENNYCIGNVRKNEKKNYGNMKRCRLIKIGINLTLITLFMYISDDTSKIMEKRIHLALAYGGDSALTKPGRIFSPGPPVPSSDGGERTPNQNYGVFNNILTRRSGCSITAWKEFLKGLGFSILNVGNVLNLKKDISISDLSKLYAKGRHPWKKTIYNIFVLGSNIIFVLIFLNILLNSIGAFEKDNILNDIFNIRANISNTFANVSTTESSKEFLQNYSTTIVTEKVALLPDYTEPPKKLSMTTVPTISDMNLLNTTVAIVTTVATKLYDKSLINATDLIGFMKVKIINCVWAIFIWAGFNVIGCLAYIKLSKYFSSLTDVENPVYALWHIALFSTLVPLYLFTLTLSNAAFFPLNILGVLGGLCIASLFAAMGFKAWCKRFYGAADMLGSVLSATFILTYIHSLIDSRFTCANQSCNNIETFLAAAITLIDCVLRMVSLFRDTSVSQSQTNKAQPSAADNNGELASVNSL